MVKLDLPEEGKTLNGVPERPLGVTSPLVKEGAKLLLSWLAMVEAAVAIMVNQLVQFKNDFRSFSFSTTMGKIIWL